MGHWKVVGASVQGESHRRKGQPCQDAHQWCELPGGILLAAVADGAGSAACAEIGSVLAAAGAIASAKDQLCGQVPAATEEWYFMLQNVFLGAREAVIAGADELEVPLGDLATTLLIAIATPDTLAAGQVGDGAVVARLEDNSFQAVTRPLIVEQEYVNETNFLTSPSFAEHTQLLVENAAVSGLALISDGLQMLAMKMPQANPHPAFFAPLLQLAAADVERDRAEEQLRTFLKSPRIADRADDDLTLLLAVRETN
jgi:serine/threonine protein phosphatase PrpC